MDNQIFSVQDALDLVLMTALMDVSTVAITIVTRYADVHFLLVLETVVMDVLGHVPFIVVTVAQATATTGVHTHVEGFVKVVVASIVMPDVVGIVMPNATQRVIKYVKLPVRPLAKILVA